MYACHWASLSADAIPLADCLRARASRKPQSSLGKKRCSAVLAGAPTASSKLQNIFGDTRLMMCGLRFSRAALPCPVLCTCFSVAAKSGAGTQDTSSSSHLQFWLALDVANDTRYRCIPAKAPPPLPPIGPALNQPVSPAAKRWLAFLRSHARAVALRNAARKNRPASEAPSPPPSTVPSAPCMRLSIASSSVPKRMLWRGMSGGTTCTAPSAAV